MEKIELIKDLVAYCFMNDRAHPHTHPELAKMLKQFAKMDPEFCKTLNMICEQARVLEDYVGYVSNNHLASRIPDEVLGCLKIESARIAEKEAPAKKTRFRNDSEKLAARENGILNYEKRLDKIRKGQPLADLAQ